MPDQPQPRPEEAPKILIAGCGTNTDVARQLLQLRANLDAEILDFLSDSKNEFVFSITAKNECRTYEPLECVFPSLRKAVEYLLNNPSKQKFKP